MPRLTSLTPYGVPGRFYAFKAKAEVAVATDAADFEKYVPFPPRIFTDHGFPTIALLHALSLDSIIGFDAYPLIIIPRIEWSAYLSHSDREILSFLYSEKSLTYQIIVGHSTIAIPTLRILQTDAIDHHESAAFTILLSEEESDKVAIISEMYKRDAYYEDKVNVNLRCSADFLDILSILEGKEALLSSILSSHKITYSKYYGTLNSHEFISSVVVPSVVKSYIKLNRDKRKN